MILNSIKQMERYARQNSNIISLGQGIPSGDRDAYIKDAVIKALHTEQNIDQYSDPQGLLKLRQKISESLEKEHMEYSADEITVTAGAIEAIDSVLLSFVTKKRNEVLVPMPTYSAYERAITCAKGKTIPILLDESHSWRLDMQAVSKKITNKTAALLLCNPNNPTGSLYDKQTLLALAALAKKHDFLLILDEVYGNMLYGDAELYTLCANQAYRKCIVRIVSFSKDFCLTGWRIGYMHADQQIMEKIVPIHDTLINCAPVISQYGAIAALDIADKVITANKQSYTLRKNLMRQALKSMDNFFSYTEPHGGYFYFPSLPDGIDANNFCNLLATKHGVVAIPGDDFGIGGKGHIRLCFGRSSEDILEGMERIREFIGGRC